MRPVHYVLTQNKLSDADMKSLGELTAKDFITEALDSGECDSLRQLLQKKGLDEKLKVAARALELAFRCGSETEKWMMRLRFTALRVWNGFSSLFFTLFLTTFVAPSR